MRSDTLAPEDGSRLERGLARAYRAFGRVEPKEVITISMMTLIIFVLLTAYYLLKTAREPLILLQGGAEVKLYVEAAQSLLLLGVVRAYGAIARRVGRVKLLAIVYLFFASNMVVFAALSRAGLHVGVVFFLWVGIFSYTSIAQFWGFAADICTEEQGKRVFPVVGIGSSLGAVLGARVAKALLPFGAHVLMLGAAVLVAGSVALIASVDRRTRSGSGRANDPAAAADQPVADETPLHLLARDKYLLLIGAVTLLLNCVSGLGDYIMDRTLLGLVRNAAALGVSPEVFIGSFKASYFGWYNAVGMVVQLFVVSRLLARWGVTAALLCLPVVVFFGFGAFTFLPALAVIRPVMILERGLDYSLTNTSRHTLFLIASRLEKYVGKTLVDTVGARLGDLFSALFVWIGALAGFGITAFSGISVILSTFWVVAVVAVGREYARRRSGAAVLVGAEARAA